MRFFPDKIYVEKKVLRWQFKLLILVSVLFFLWLLHKPILVGLGAYLEVPSSDQKSDVVFVDGGDVISRFSMVRAIEMLKFGKAKNLLITVADENAQTNVFGLREYRQIVLSELERQGIPDSIVFFHEPIFGDPYTFHLAVGLKDFLNEHRFKSIALLQDNFHIKRSYLTFKKILEPHGMSVHPEKLEIYLNKNNWWKNTNGVRRVYGEYYKLIYYKLKGYI